MKPAQRSKPATDKSTDESTPKPRRTYGGRKAKPEAERKVTCVKIYLDERQLTQLHGQLKEYNFFHGQLCRADFIKKCCHLDGSVPKARPTTTNPELDRLLIQDIRKLASHLGAMSTNYNQSVKRINSLPVSKKLIDEVEQFKPFHAELMGHTDELKQLIVRITEYSSQLK